MLEIPSDFNLLEDTVELVPQFDLLCSAGESESLREINDSVLSRGMARMALRVRFLSPFSLFCAILPSLIPPLFFFPLFLFQTYMMEIQSARRAKTRAEVFLKMAAKYLRYRDKCREMHAQLRVGGNT